MCFFIVTFDSIFVTQVDVAAAPMPWCRCVKSDNFTTHQVSNLVSGGLGEGVRYRLCLELAQPCYHARR